MQAKEKEKTSSNRVFMQQVPNNYELKNEFIINDNLQKCHGMNFIHFPS